MVTNLDKFKKRMEPAKELYTCELLDFTRNFDALGEMTLIEDQDIDTQHYIYSFENLNGTSEKELDEILLEIYAHMKVFSSENSIEEFYQFVRISFP